MISKINVNPFRPAFGVVSQKAKEEALRRAGTNQKAISDVNSIIDESNNTVPDFEVVYQNNVFDNTNSFFVNAKNAEDKIYIDSIMNKDESDYSDEDFGYEPIGFNGACKIAKLAQELKNKAEAHYNKIEPLCQSDN